MVRWGKTGLSPSEKSRTGRVTPFGQKEVRADFRRGDRTAEEGV